QLPTEDDDRPGADRPAAVPRRRERRLEERRRADRRNEGREADLGGARTATDPGRAKNRREGPDESPASLLGEARRQARHRLEIWHRAAQVRRPDHVPQGRFREVVLASGDFVTTQLKVRRKPAWLPKMDV